MKPAAQARKGDAVRRRLIATVLMGIMVLAWVAPTAGEPARQDEAGAKGSSWSAGWSLLMDLVSGYLTSPLVHSGEPADPLDLEPVGQDPLSTDDAGADRELGPEFDPDG